MGLMDQNIMRRFCEILPEDRILHGNDHDLDSFLQEEEGRRTFTVKSTGAKLTYHSAIAILARYASSLVSFVAWIFKKV